MGKLIQFLFRFCKHQKAPLGGCGDIPASVKGVLGSISFSDFRKGFSNFMSSSHGFDTKVTMIKVPFLIKTLKYLGKYKIMP